MSAQPLSRLADPATGKHRVDPLTLTLTLTAEQFEAIAHRVAEMLRPEEPASSLSPYLTVPEAAGLLRASRQRVDDLLSQRRLTRYKDGTRTLVSRAEVEAHLRGERR